MDVLFCKLRIWLLENLPADQLEQIAEPNKEDNKHTYNFLQFTRRNRNYDY